MGLKQNCNVRSWTIKLQTGVVFCHRIDLPRECSILGVLNERRHIIAKPAIWLNVGGSLAPPDGSRPCPLRILHPGLRFAL
jgi:hypothetical protein